MRVELERASHKGWESWHLRRGPLELVLVPQVGGRIMGMKWQGLDLAFTQPEREGIVEHVGRDGAVRARKRELGFPLWGGDKTWLAPQSRWTDELPFLDLDSGPYDLAIDQATHERVQVSMVSPVCRETGMRITRTVVLSSSDDEWRVIHRLTNASINEVGWGAWDVSMVARPGKVYLPVNPASPYPGLDAGGDPSRGPWPRRIPQASTLLAGCRVRPRMCDGGVQFGSILLSRDGDPRTRRAIAPGREFPDGGTSGCVRPPRLARFRRGSPCSWPVSPTGHVVPDPVRWELRAVSTSLGASRHGAPSSDLPVQRQQASCLVNAPSAADVPRPSL